MTDTVAAAERHVLDVVTAAGKPLTITDIASRLFADPLRVTPVVIGLFTVGRLTKHVEPGPTDSISVVTYGIPNPNTETGKDPADVNAPAVGRARPYPSKGQADLRAQNGAERLTGP